MRAGVHLATILKLPGIKGLNTDYDPDYLPDRAIELVMRILPFDTSMTARWAGIYFVYGDVFDHSNINEETMDSRCPVSSASATSRSSSTSRG